MSTAPRTTRPPPVLALLLVHGAVGAAEAAHRWTISTFSALPRLMRRCGFSRAPTAPASPSWAIQMFSALRAPTETMQIVSGIFDACTAYVGNQQKQKPRFARLRRRCTFVCFGAYGTYITYMDNQCFLRDLRAYGRDGSFVRRLRRLHRLHEGISIFSALRAPPATM